MVKGIVKFFKFRNIVGQIVTFIAEKETEMEKRELFVGNDWKGTKGLKLHSLFLVYIMNIFGPNSNIIGPNSNITGKNRNINVQIGNKNSFLAWE